MKYEKETKEILENLYQYNFNEAYKILEDFISQNPTIYFKDNNEIFENIMFFPIKIGNIPHLSIFYRSSVGPIIVFHKLIRSNFDQIIANQSMNKNIFIKQKGDIIFEK